MEIINVEIRVKLDEQLQRVENAITSSQQKLQSISALIIEVFKIQENIVELKPVVETFLFELIEQIKKKQGEDMIFLLGHILKEEVEGAQIINNFQQFSSYKTGLFIEQVEKQDMNYILAQLNLSATIQAELKELYNIYFLKYNQIIEECQFNQKLFINIIDQTKLIPKFTKLPQKSKQDTPIMLNLIALVSAYWTLTQSGEQKIGQKVRLKKPHPAQILSVIFLLGIHDNNRDSNRFWQLQEYFGKTTKFQNKIIEIPTGEGKSLSLGFSALVLALSGYEVDVICYSSFLSQRDDKQFRSIFYNFGVSKRINQSTFMELAERYINSHLFVRDSVLKVIQGNNLDEDVKLQSKTNERILLIDEVDIFFNLDFYGETYNIMASFQSPEIEKIIKDIWNQRNLSEQPLNKAIKNSINYTNLINKFPQFTEYIKRQIQQLCESVKNFKEHLKIEKISLKILMLEKISIKILILTKKIYY